MITFYLILFIERFFNSYIKNYYDLFYILILVVGLIGMLNLNTKLLNFFNISLLAILLCYIISTNI